MNLIQSLPEELVIFFTSMLPLLELRFSIPFAIISYQIPLYIILILAIIGSVIPVIPIFYFLAWLEKELRHLAFINNFLSWLYKKTRKKTGIIQQLELLGLILFVAVPLPTTGVWTGTVAAYLFGFSKRKTLICCTIGTTIAASIVSVLTIIGKITLNHL